jgi:hypothetical protein
MAAARGTCWSGVFLSAAAHEKYSKVARPEIREWLLQSIFAAPFSGWLVGWRARSRRVKIVLNENLNSQLFIHSFKYRLVISGGTPPAATTPQLSPPNIAPNAQHFDFCRHHRAADGWGTGVCLFTAAFCPSLFF